MRQLPHTNGTEGVDGNESFQIREMADFLDAAGDDFLRQHLFFRR